MSTLSLKSVLIGIVATLTMDVLTVTATKLELIAPLPPQLIGRRFASLVCGRALHRDIGSSTADQSPTCGRCACALCRWRHSNAAASVGKLGVRSELMFPAMGCGWFGARGREETRLVPMSGDTLFHGFGLRLSVSLL